MAFVHGKDATLSIDAANISAFTDNVSFSRDVDTAETSTFGDSDKTYITGLNGATLNCGGKWDASVDGTMAGAQDGAVVAFDYSPDGGTTSYTGNCFLTNYSPDSSVSGAGTWSASFIVSGAVTRT